MLDYLDLAARIVDEAAANWFLPDGTYCDPYEAGDRWAGGCTARFVCPAAILINRRGRADLLPMVAEQMDRLCGLIQAGKGTPGGGLPHGVLDLVSKEIQVAFRELRSHVDPAQHARWQASLTDIEPGNVYTGTGKLRGGHRLTNYEIYASVGEWLRHCHGQTPDTQWLETMLAASQPLFTGLGMYRDPNDPMTYDLSVRQNLSELLHYGYNGDHAEIVQGQLARAGLATLQMVSPLGYAPYGGRSNHFVHNEAMLTYICEFEARRWRPRDPAKAASFRAVARRALEMVTGFVDLDPPRNLKSRFPPSTKFGRDTGYGEYGVYSLLAASLLARTFLVADEAIPVADAWPDGTGTVLHLDPAFHRLFATVGDTFVQLDTQGQPGHDATGVGRFHRLGVPAPLGGSLSIAAQPKYIVGECATDRGVAIGPGWLDASGNWQWLAECADRVLEVELVHQHISPGMAEWELQHVLAGDTPVTVRQRFRLTPGHLSIEAEIAPAVQEIAFMVPCLHSDGESEASLVWDQLRATVQFHGACLTARVPAAHAVSVDSHLRASREAIYRVLESTVRGAKAVLELSLLPE